MDKVQFEEERAKILEKALSGLDQISSNLNVLNRNIETINSIGTQFGAPAQLWSSFHKAIGATESEKLKANNDDIIKENSDVSLSVGENERI